VRGFAGGGFCVDIVASDGTFVVALRRARTIGAFADGATVLGIAACSTASLGGRAMPLAEPSKSTVISTSGESSSTSHGSRRSPNSCFM
jgi:hypothetical protein